MKCAKKLLRVGLFVLMSGGATGKAIAQSVLLGYVSLDMGAPREAVLARLGAKYSLGRSSTTEDRWWVSDTSLWHPLRSYGNVGTIAFRSGRLALVKAIDMDTSSAVAALDEFFVVLGTPDFTSGCSSAYSQLATPMIFDGTLFLDCGRRSVYFSLDKNGDVRSYRVTLVWTWLPPKKDD